MSKLLSSLLLSSLALADASASPTCVHADSFTSISFDNATLVTSNLGGEGGRCSTAGLCSQLESASTPPDIYFAGVGAVVDATSGTTATVDLRVSNETEYRARNANLNGIKRQEEGGSTGFFGVVNLLGPRSQTQLPLTLFWHNHFTYVQLRYDFLCVTHRCFISSSLALALITSADTLLSSPLAGTRPRRHPSSSAQRT